MQIASIQETCLDKVLRWFEATEASAFVRENYARLEGSVVKVTLWFLL